MSICPNVSWCPNTNQNDYYFIICLPIHIVILLSLKSLQSLENSVHLFDARALKSERLAFQSCWMQNCVTAKCYGSSCACAKGYIYDQVKKLCVLNMVPVPATEVYCDLDHGSQCGYNAKCIYDSGSNLKYFC